jgi:Rrf2 family iron-sulfur cluster assembly transcriptional regulator
MMRVFRNDWPQSSNLREVTLSLESALSAPLLMDHQERSMRMSTKSRFAVQAMIDLALRERSGPVALAHIASRQGVSLSYLEQLFSRLRRAGLVESTRGPGGGYTMGRGIGEISAADIVSAVEDDVPDEVSTGGRMQLTRDLWADLDAVMLRHLATVPLQQLVDEAKGPGRAGGPAVVRAAPCDRSQPGRAAGAHDGAELGVRFRTIVRRPKLTPGSGRALGPGRFQAVTCTAGSAATGRCRGRCTAARWPRPGCP